MRPSSASNSLLFLAALLVLNVLSVWQTSTLFVSAQPALDFTTQAWTGFDCNAAPTVVSFNQQFHMFFMDPNGNGLQHISAPQSTLLFSKYSGDVFGQSTSATPNAVATLPTNSGTNTLNVFFRDSAGSATHYIVGDINDNWTAPLYDIGLDVDNQPEAAVAPPSASYPGRIVVVGAEHGGNRIGYVYIDAGIVKGSGWVSGGQAVQSGAPCIVWFKDSFYVFYPIQGGNKIMMASSQDGNTWSSPSYIGYDTSTGLSAVVYRANTLGTVQYLYLFFRDPAGNEVFYAYTTDGITFGDSGLHTGMFISDEPSATAQISAIGPTPMLMIAGKYQNSTMMMFIVAKPAP